MRKIIELNTTTNSRVYKMYRRFYTLRCDRCKPHRGENRKWFSQRNWKKFRKNQWK